MKIFNLIILDESGSMDVIKRETMDGFNETVRTIVCAQKEFVEQEHFVSLVSFNGLGIRTFYRNVKVDEVAKLDDKRYEPRGCTPLLDAIGKAVSDQLEFLEQEKDYTVLVSILTDGEENASTKYSVVEIDQLISRLKEEGWIFTYMGANHDVKKFADTISIKSTMEFVSSSSGMNRAFKREKKARMNAFSKLSQGISSFFMNEDYFDDED